MAAYRIDPTDAPALNSRIPHAQSGAVHVVFRIGARIAIRRPGHYPDVLACAALKDPPEVSFALDLLRRNLISFVMKHDEIPGPDQPPVYVRRFGDIE